MYKNVYVATNAISVASICSSNCEFVEETSLFYLTFSSWCVEITDLDSEVHYAPEHGTQETRKPFYRFQDLTAMTERLTLLWNVTLCRLLDRLKQIVFSRKSNP